MRVLSAGAAKPSSTTLVAGGAKIESGGSSGGGGGGATVNAINKTGAMITTGKKVWLNQYSQEAGNKLEFTTQYALTTVSRDGDFVMTNQTASASPMTIYSADGDLSLSTVTSINKQAGKIGTVKYGPDNSMFLLPISGQGGTSRIDGEKQWTNTTYWYQGDNIFSYQNSSTYEYYKIDLETGNILKTYVAQGHTNQILNMGHWSVSDTFDNLRILEGQDTFIDWIPDRGWPNLYITCFRFDELERAHNTYFNCVGVWHVDFPQLYEANHLFGYRNAGTDNEKGYAW